MLEKLKTAIFGDKKEKELKKIEAIIDKSLPAVQAYLCKNGLWEHEYGTPYVRRLRDGYRATVFNVNGSWCCEVRNQYGNYVTSEVVHNGDDIEKTIEKFK